MNNFHYSIKLAIIIPVYNAEKTIRRAIDSILSQTMKEFIVICIDDKSKDGSLKILEEYAASDKRVIVLKNEINKGCGGLTRNVGLEYLFNKIKNNVEFVTFLDADDNFEDNNYFDIAYRKAIETNSDVVLHAHKVIYLQENDDAYLCDFEFEEKTYDGNCLRIFGENEKMMFCCTSRLSIIRKELIRNLRYSKLFAEDAFYLIYVLSLAKRATTIPGRYYNYYFGVEDSMLSKTKSEIIIKDLFIEIKDILKYFKDRGDLASFEFKITIISILLRLIIMLVGVEKIPSISTLNNVFGLDLTSKEIYENPKLFKLSKILIDSAKKSQD